MGVIPTRMMPMGVRKKPYDAKVEYLDVPQYQITETSTVNYLCQVRTGFFWGPDTSCEIDIETLSTDAQYAICPDGAVPMQSNNNNGAGINSFGFGVVGTFDGTRRDLNFVLSREGWGIIKVYGDTCNTGYKFTGRRVLSYDATTRLAKCVNPSTGSVEYSKTLTDYGITTRYSSEVVLFSGYSTSTNRTGAGCGRFRRMRIWESGVLIHDYIPVRVGQVGYVYDAVAGGLLGVYQRTSGTWRSSAFALGPDAT